MVDRYKKLKYGDILRTNKLQINYEEMIEKALIKFPNLTKQEAFLIFAYTDEFLFNNLNFKLRTA
ncbi:MAG: hypothetical protein LBU14_05915 [Candidatus Peribacteria bacterium]|nr:hypothetical protein [Candidatus Peribacteria bacterium]